MKPTISSICGALGVGLALATSLMGINAILNCFNAAQRSVSLPDSGVAVLGEIIGELVVASIIHGIVAIIPAVLIYLALTFFRLRKPWFYSSARIASYFLLPLLPFGTICGFILLRMSSRRRTEFATSGKLPDVISDPSA